jgi:hypothetical protein
VCLLSVPDVADTGRMAIHELVLDAHLGIVYMVTQAPESSDSMLHMFHLV